MSSEIEFGAFQPENFTVHPRVDQAEADILISRVEMLLAARRERLRPGVNMAEAASRHAQLSKALAAFNARKKPLPGGDPG